MLQYSRCKLHLALVVPLLASAESATETQADSPLLSLHNKASARILEATHTVSACALTNYY